MLFIFSTVFIPLNTEFLAPWQHWAIFVYEISTM